MMMMVMIPSRNDMTVGVSLITLKKDNFWRGALLTPTHSIPLVSGDSIVPHSKFLATPLSRVVSSLQYTRMCSCGV